MQNNYNLNQIEITKKMTLEIHWTYQERLGTLLNFKDTEKKSYKKEIYSFML
jgi:hypothetical protein